MESKWIFSLAALAATAGMGLGQAPRVATAVRTGSPGAAAPIPADEIPDPGVDPPSPRRALPAVVAPPSATALFPAAAGPTCFEQRPTGYDDGRISAHAEYLLWFFKRSHVPILFGSIPPDLANQRDLPASSIQPIFGGNHDAIDYRGQSGVRFGVGGWLDAEQDVGLDVDYFQLERGSLGANAQSAPSGLPIIGPTFSDPVANRETILLFSDPGVRAAALNLSSDARFWGAEANIRHRLPAVFADHLEFLAGFRYAQFDENLRINGTSTATDPNGLSVGYQDEFSVRNRFYGPQVGLSSDFTYNRLFLNLKGKFAAGEMYESASIGGTTSLIGAPPPLSAGGILTQRTNSGGHSRTVFSILPEITVNTGVQFNDHLRAFVGYNLIYVDRLQRTGSLIDGVDATQVRALNLQPNMNATRPGFQFQDGRFWAYGLNLGMELSF
jgi:Putative beta barrel porin-7 (BBP7)